MGRLKKKLRLKLKEKIAFILILSIIISSVAIGVAAVMAQYRALIDDTGKRLTSLAHYAASHIDGDDLNAITDPQSEETQHYVRIRGELKQVIESANKIPISQISEILRMEGKGAGKNLKAVLAYTLRKDGDKILYGADAFSSQDNTYYEKPGTVITNPIKVTNVNHIYSGIPYFASEPYTDEFGTWITGYARVFDSEDNIAGVVCVDASIEFIYGKAWRLALQIIIFGVVLIILASIVSFYLSKRITTPLILLNQGAGIIGDGDLDYNISIHTGDEIEDLSKAFNKMAEDLKIHIEDLKRTTAEKEHIQSELKIAQKIQTSMLPRIFPPFPDREDFSIYATMNAAKEVGGDFYDFFLVDKNKLCFIIGDVSGKGVPAALFMVIAKTLLKNQALMGSPTDEILYKVNNLLCSENEEMMFVTVFIGIIDTETGELQYSNAGHNPPLLSRKGEAYGFIHPKKSFVLAGMENFKYQSETLQMNEGDTIFLYTDGVTEAMDIDSNQFSESRLKDALAKLVDRKGEDVVHSIHHEVEAFVQDAPQSDDITMLVLRYNGSK